MLLRLLYIAVFIVVSVLGYKAWVLHDVMNFLQKAPFENALGPEDAAVTVVEFLDYRCSFCRDVHPDMQAFLENNKDVRVVFRHVPILGESSLRDAQFALAAGMQGKFAEVHNRLMARDEPIDDDYIFVVASELDMDYDRLLADMKNPEITGVLLGNVDAMEWLGINSTPTFLFNDTIFAPYDRMPTVEDFEKLKEEALL